MHAPLVTSEAACAGHAPENTLAGVEEAIRLGADAIEIDVHCTSDGVPVLLHDETVDRTTDATGNVHEMTWAHVRTLDAGARQFAPAFAGARIPSLAEVVDVTRGKVLLQIEIKQAGIEEQVVRVVRDAGAIDDCESHSFQPEIVRAMRAVEPRMAAVVLRIGRSIVDWGTFFAEALSLNAQGVSLYHQFVTPDIVQRCQRRGLRCMIWTVDDDAGIERMLAAGVDSINSNFPERVRRIVDAAAASG
jgi:glycerophosphoryl diester phosphodiesterase